MADKNLEDILSKVRGLLAKADSTPFPAEAEAFRKGAEALMVKYRLDESQLTAEEKVQRAISVGFRTFDISSTSNEFGRFYRDMMYSVVSHFDCRVKTDMSYDAEGDPIYQMTVCGFESDLAFIDLVYTSAALAFRERLEPQYDPNESEQVNAYRMRKAGMEGHRIAMAIYGRNDKSLRPKVRKMFADECVARGEDPKSLTGKGVNVKLFRESYATAFTEELAQRLYRMRYENVGDGMVLASRKDEINEAFWTRYPTLRPRPAQEAIGNTSTQTCKKCTAAKSGYCNDHRYMRPRKPRVRYGNAAGFAAGRDAARTVDLGITGRKIGGAS